MFVDLNNNFNPGNYTTFLENRFKELMRTMMELRTQSNILQQQFSNMIQDAVDMTGNKGEWKFAETPQQGIDFSQLVPVVFPNSPEEEK